ncbi:GntR family transcriptional regulator [Actinosynnema sp. CS-041913]|uniref:GntR family transcriptional regulator n=1 Tax=Actinosynnema sp. CS-041913 TaxID=3239917 RepID=UPI003D90BFCD
MNRIPTPPVTFPGPHSVRKVDPRSPYETVAALERTRIVADEIPDGTPAPSVKELATRHGVSIGTAHWALCLLKEWGLVARTGRGVRPVIVRTEGDDEDAPLYEEQNPTAVARLPVPPAPGHTEPDPVAGVGNRPLQLEISKRTGTDALG